MKESGFLARLAKKGKLKLVEPSEEICKSYLVKSGRCLRSGKILLENDLYENSVSECYYAMYNALTAALFRAGIKCENHAASIILLDKVFGRSDLSDVIAKAKGERIDKQYYIDSGTGINLTKESAVSMVKMAEEFALDVKLLIDGMGSGDVAKCRANLSRILRQDK